jgi:predicted RecB family nuclease
MSEAPFNKVCVNGHKFQKSSDCPVCPTCAAEERPETGFLSVIVAPARRALEREGITTLKRLSEYSEKELLMLHGVGPSTIPKLKKELESSGYAFKE